MTSDSLPTPTRTFVVAIVAAMVGAAAMGAYAYRDSLSGLAGTASAGPSPQVRNFTFDIKPADIEMGNGAVWHAWTFNGTIPGPTLTATAGDVLRVTIRNTMNITHSFHTHLSPYSLENDGSQLNTITGIGGMAMIPPGESYTYEFLATIPGVFYYHCHSADGGHTIARHMAQGLYGAIIIKAPEEAPVREEAIFMAERGFDVTGEDAPFYIMNGHGLPGGEKALEEIFAAEGIAGIKKHLGTTIPVISGRVNEPVRIAVVNIGDQIHSFHLHAMTAYSVDQNPGRPVPAQVVQLVPGGADRILVTPTQPGLWLFHCHVVSHADQGMIGVFIVQPEKGELVLKDPEPGASHGGHTPTPTPPPQATPTPPTAPEGGDASKLSVLAGSPANELRFAPGTLTAEKGAIEVAVKNGGQAPHSFTVRNVASADTGQLTPGQSKTLKFAIEKAGAYEYYCTVPGHFEAGMKGTLTVTE